MSDPTCPSCRQPVVPGDRFCQHCGAPTPPAASYTDPRPDRQTVPVMVPADDGRRSAYAWLVAAAVVLLFVVTGVVFAVGKGDSGRPDAGPTPAPVVTTPAIVADGQDLDPDYTPAYTPDTGQVDDTASGSLLGYVSASAPVTSPDSQDNEGNPTTYVVSNLLDGDPATAWRMDGSAEGETLTFTFDTERTVDHLGLVNGFAKIDPDGTEDRYPENRRVLAVTWVVGNATYSQTLTDGDRDVQDIQINPTPASSIELRITAVSSPGTGNVDRTAISDVLIAND